MPEQFADAVAAQNWMRPLESALGRLVRGGLARLGTRREPVERWLHGEPLGHPLHVMLTDIPLGSWTAALVADGLAATTGDSAYDTAAKTALSVGVAGAVAAAVTGLADWSRLRGSTRRVGLAHGLINLAGVAVMAGAAVGPRTPRKRLATVAGFALAVTAARLGGHLVYQQGIGTRFTTQPSARDQPWAA